MTLPDPSINAQPTGAAGAAPMDFSAPKPGSAPVGAQYDADGYPIPSPDDVAKFHKIISYNTTRSPDGSAYDPDMPPPEPYDSAKWPNYEKWKKENDNRAYNQQAKQAWQKSHETSKRQGPAPAASAPATPFQSSGIDLTKQGKGESYIDSILQSYGESGVPQVGNQSQQTLESFRNSQPANTDPYYDQASKLASAKIDNAMAARGSYGSSNATGQIGAAEVALRAQQARDNASYGLQRFAQEGNLAGAADQQGNTANGIQYQWTKGLADLATKDQDLGQGRNQDLWNNNFSLAAAKAGIYGAGAGAAIEGVTDATDAAINAKQGVASDALSNANSNANTSNSATAGLLNAANQGVSNYVKYNNGKSN